MAAEKVVFEKDMKRLEEIAAALEKGDAPLDQSLALFEEGTGLIRRCGAALDGAEQKIKLLLQTPDGPAFAEFPEEGK